MPQNLDSRELTVDKSHWAYAVHRVKGRSHVHALLLLAQAQHVYEGRTGGQPWKKREELQNASTIPLLRSLETY